MNNLTEYEQMRDNGATADEVYLAAKNKHGNSISYERLMRHVFGVTLGEARELIKKGEEYIFRKSILPHYIELQSKGAKAIDIYIETKNQNLGPLDRMKVLISLFDISILEAKKIAMQAEDNQNALG